MSIEARSLRYFAEIVGCGSMSRAAETLGISQPALSKCIRDLETQLRVRLLDRSSTGVTPTVYGRTLYLRATSVTAEISRAQAEIEALVEADAGLVTVGVLPSQTHVLPAAALRMLKARPKLRLRIMERARHDLMAGLLRGEFDLVVSVISPNHMPPNVSYDILFRDRPSVILRKDHPLNEDPNVSIRSLCESGYPWVVPPADSERRADLEHVLRSGNIGWPPKTAIECHSSAFLRALVLQSDCIGLLANDTRTIEEQLGLVRSMHLENVPVGRSIGLLYRNDYPRTEGAMAVMREIKATMAWQNHGQDPKAIVQTTVAPRIRSYGSKR